MKAGDVPFHLPYGSLICTNRLQSDRSKCRGMLVDPGTPRGNAEIRCFEPDLNDIFLLRKLKFLISLDSPRSPPSSEIWQPDLLKAVTVWETKLWRMFLRLEGKQWDNRGCFSLSGCHLTVSQSWASYHTLFERADSGLSADYKILNFS